jgi:high-affinity K+ transport system ATPase subunit B
LAIVRQRTFIRQIEVEEKHFIKCVVLSSMSDETPEGKSIIELAGVNPLNYSFPNPRYIKFTAETRCSGIDFDQTRIRKGASDAIRESLPRRQEMLTLPKLRSV